MLANPTRPFHARRSLCCSFHQLISLFTCPCCKVGQLHALLLHALMVRFDPNKARKEGKKGARVRTTAKIHTSARTTPTAR